MGELDYRLAELRRQQEAEQQNLATQATARAAGWDKVIRAAQWALNEYRRAGIQPLPIFWEWTERRSQRGLLGGRSPQEIQHEEQLTSGYDLCVWEVISSGVNRTDALMITTDGDAIVRCWAHGFGSRRVLRRPAYSAAPAPSGPRTAETLRNYAITDYKGTVKDYTGSVRNGENAGQGPDWLVDTILLYVAGRVRQ